MEVMISSTPVMNRKVGTQKELPRATAARSTALTRPAMAVSTNPSRVWDSWAARMGSASQISARNSVTLRRHRVGVSLLVMKSTSEGKATHPINLPLIVYLPNEAR